MIKFFRRAAGFTLIELMVVVAIAALLLLVAAPSFQRLIETQRLRGTAAQLVTDLQLARGEAVARNEWVRFSYDTDLATMTCYTIFTSTANGQRCDCTLGAGNACTDARTKEIKTVQVLNSTRVAFAIPPGQTGAFAFDQLTGSISDIPTDDDSSPLVQFTLITKIDAARTLHVTLNHAGRVTVCTPPGSEMGGPAC